MILVETSYIRILKAPSDLWNQMLADNFITVLKDELFFMESYKPFSGCIVCDSALGKKMIDSLIFHGSTYSDKSLFESYKTFNEPFKH